DSGMSIVEVELDLAQEQGALSRVLRALAFPPYTIDTVTFVRAGAAPDIDRATIVLDLDDSVTSGSPTLLRSRLERMVALLRIEVRTLEHPQDLVDDAQLQACQV